jgi:hypothetical protein
VGDPGGDVLSDVLNSVCGGDGDQLLEHYLFYDVSSTLPAGNWNIV